MGNAHDSDGNDRCHTNLCVVYLSQHHHLLPAGARELALVALRLAQAQLLSEEERENIRRKMRTGGKHDEEVHDG